MSIGEVLNALGVSALISVKADVSDIKAKMKDLRGEEKLAHEQILKTATARADSMEKLQKAFVVGTAVFKGAQLGISAMTGAWEKYEKAAKAAGGAEAERAEKFRRALDEWGAIIDKSTMQLGRLIAEQAEYVNSLAHVAAGIQKVASAADDFLSSIPGGSELSWLRSHSPIDPIGYAKLGIKGLGAGADYLTDANVSDIAGAVSEWITTQRNIASEQEKIAANSARAAIAQASEEIWGFKPVYRGGGRTEFVNTREAGPENEPYYNETHRKKSGGAGGELTTFGNENYSPVRNGYFRGGAYEDRSGWLGSSPTSQIGWLGAEGYGGVSGQKLEQAFLASQQFSDTQGRWAAAGQRSDYKKGVLESIFGPLDQFDAYAEKMGLLGDATAAFTASLQTGFDAWVSGSMTAVQAVKAAFAQTVSAIASSMFAHALEHGAAAIGDLAWGNLAGAATHAKAAALYAGGAVAVGAIARQLNAGASASAGAAASSYGGGAANVIGAGGAGGSTSTSYYYIGDNFGANSPRFERQRAERSYKLARRTVGESTTVRWS